MKINWRRCTDFDEADKVAIQLILHSGKHRQLFQVKKELPMGELLRNPDYSIKCAEIFRDVLVEMGDRVLTQVKSRKIVFWDNDTGKMVEHKIEVNWIPE